MTWIRQSGDTPMAIILQFVGTFGVWLLADRIGLSGILTIVTYAITIARQAPASTPAQLRIPSYAVWETAVFVLNVLAFVLIGLPACPIVESLDPATLMTSRRRGGRAADRDRRARAGCERHTVVRCASARGLLIRLDR